MSSDSDSGSTRAAVLRQPRTPLRVETLSVERPREGEVGVRIKASGVCHSDLRTADGEWAFPGPVVLGHEGAGIVAATGAGVTRPKVGDHVVLSWFPPCLSCSACQQGQQWLCSGNRSLTHRPPDGTSRLHGRDGSEILPYLGLGTFADHTVVPSQAAVPIPASVPFEIGALIGCCVSTGVGAVLKTAEVAAGSSVSVFGLGGVGLSAIMGSVVAGATTIVAVDREPEKLERALTVGATEAVQAENPERTVESVLEVSGGGVDYVFEAVGYAGTIEQSLRVVRPGGTVVLIGMTPEGVRPGFDSFDFVDRSLRILGSNYGFTVAAVDFPKYAQLFLAGRLPIDALIEERIDLVDVNAALESLRRGRGLRRVIVWR